MKVKRFSEYSKGEQRNLLMHWWFYYSKVPYTFIEFNKFRKAVERDAQVVMNMVFAASLCEKSNEDILNAMRLGNFEEYWDYMEGRSKTTDFKEMYAAGEHFLIEEIADSYRNPRPRDESSKRQILADMAKILKSNGYELTSDRVRNLYKQCMINEMDFCAGELHGDFTIAEGFKSNAIFMTERLNHHRKEIFECIEMLPGLNRGSSFLKLFKDKNGNDWTADYDVLDMLIQLGLATDMIYFPLPRESWENLPGSGPIVASNYVGENHLVTGHKPYEYKKLFEKLQNGTYKKDV